MAVLSQLSSICAIATTALRIWQLSIWCLWGWIRAKIPSVVNGFATSGNYFDVLRIQPYLGQFFHASDEHGPQQRAVYRAQLRVLA